MFGESCLLRGVFMAVDFVRMEDKAFAYKLRRDGWSWKDIGKDLGLSEDTVKDIVIEYAGILGEDLIELLKPTKYEND